MSDRPAGRSVLADYVGESDFDNQGQRVVVGQRLVQAAGDIFLGWTRAAAPGRPVTDYYLRQLRDWKYSVPIERLDAASLAAGVIVVLVVFGLALHESIADLAATVNFLTFRPFKIGEMIETAGYVGAVQES